jgi:hypothetical protein
VGQQGTGGLEIGYRLKFDLSIAPGLLGSDPPAGYTQVVADED